MALFRHRAPDTPRASSAVPQVVLLRYAIGRRKIDVDRFTQLQQLLSARLRRLGLGRCGGTAEQTSVVVQLTGSDCRALWDASERAALWCPLPLLEVELRSGDPGAPTVRFPPPEQFHAELRGRLELTRTSGGVPQRRVIAFDLMHRIEQLEESEALRLAEVGDDTYRIECRREDLAYVVHRRSGLSRTSEHVVLGSADSAFDAMLAWAAVAPEPDLLTWRLGAP